jgi:endonuclease G
MPSVFRRLLATLQPRREHADGAVWYVEARPLHEVEGKLRAPPEPSLAGSGVVVRLEVLGREEGGERWQPSEPPVYRRYLLTCAHVVRGHDGQGWGPLLDEVLCWRAGSRYQHWLVPEVARPGGDARAVGAHRAQAAIAPLPPGPVAAAEATSHNDWILLAVDDGPSGPFGSAPAVGAWAAVGTRRRWRWRRRGGDLAVVGYPGGAASWAHNDEVVPHTSEGFSVKREAAGAVLLRGPDETRAGMSGGPVFDRRGGFVGIHRAANDRTMERHLVPAERIRSWLEENGYRPAPAGVGSRSPGVWARAVAAAATVALAAAAWVWWPRAPPANVCVDVRGAEPPLMLQPVPSLQLRLVGDGWDLPEPATTITGGDGKACFKVAVPRHLRQRDSLPFFFRCVVGPEALRERSPLVVEPHGVTSNDLKRDSADLLHYFGDEEAPRITLAVWSEATWLAAQLSRQLPSGGGSDEGGQIARAASELGLTDVQRRTSVAAWADVLRQDRPVVPVARLAEADAGEIQRLAGAVGAFFEDGEWRATGFAVSETAVLVPAFAVTEARERTIRFAPSLDGPGRPVRLGRELWRSRAGTPTELTVALFAAEGELPAAPTLAQDPAGTFTAGRAVYVVGFPGDDGRAPPELRRLFAMGERSAMFGEVVGVDARTRSVDHDATTIGGTGGAPLVDRATHAVIGVHLSGRFQGSLHKLNSAASMGALLADPTFEAALGPRAGYSVARIGAEAAATDPLALAAAGSPTSGYDPTFLGTNAPLPVTAGRQVVRLDYLHYTVLLNRERRTALLAAANLDRSTKVEVRRDYVDRWYLDPRVPAGAQPSADLFAGNRIDRGHLISRTALAWGSPEVARLGALAAFYWTNASPQLDGLNQRAWATLERRVYEQLHPGSGRVAVFAGPVEDAADVTYRGFRIPRRFWMVAAFRNAGDPARPHVHAFVADNYPAGVVGDPDDWPRSVAAAAEVSLGEVERLTGLRFALGPAR